MRQDPVHKNGETHQIQQVTGWHQQLGREYGAANLEWDSCGIEPFEFIEGGKRAENRKHWTIRELLNSEALVTEGRAMRHCVATYSHSCARGRTSIWSMVCETRKGAERVLTVEVGSRSAAQSRELRRVR